MWWLLYRDCHGLFKPSQWWCVGTVIASKKQSINNYSSTICHCEQKQSINNYSPSFVIASEAKQSTNHKTVIKKQKRKEVIIIYQIKELIFNFQFWSSLRSFRTSWDDKLKWLSKHIIFPLCASIFSQPPCCFATSPLTKGGKPHKPLIINTKKEKKKNSLLFNKPKN